MANRALFVSAIFGGLPVAILAILATGCAGTMSGPEGSSGGSAGGESGGEAGSTANAGTGAGGNPTGSGGNGMSGGAPAGAGAGGKGGNVTPPPDAGATGDAAPPRVPADAAPPAGLVPMFVASGQGGRTITSCDDGRTWVGDHSYETVDYGSNINFIDHSAYASKGLAYGQGTFIALMAWGAPASLKISDDGVTWTRVFNKLADPTGGFFGGLGFGGGAFVLLRQQVVQISADQGKTWKPATVQPGGDFREGGGGDTGIFGGGSGDNWMSWDGGKTWKAASGCPKFGFGGIGEYGGVASGNGNLVMVGDNGQTCRVSAGGTQFQAGSLGEPAIGKVFFTGDKFWVINGGKAFTSDDGGAWKATTLQPAGTTIHVIARAASGTYAGAYKGGSRFYRSSDGINWTAAVAPAKGNQIFRMVAGYGKPSALCPGP